MKIERKHILEIGKNEETFKVDTVSNIEEVDKKKWRINKLGRCYDKYERIWKGNRIETQFLNLLRKFGKVGRSVEKEIIPKRKKGDERNWDSYRPIYLAKVAFKQRTNILEHRKENRYRRRISVVFYRFDACDLIEKHIIWKYWKTSIKNVYKNVIEQGRKMEKRGKNSKWTRG